MTIRRGGYRIATHPTVVLALISRRVFLIYSSPLVLCIVDVSKSQDRRNACQVLVSASTSNSLVLSNMGTLRSNNDKKVSPVVQDVPDTTSIDHGEQTTNAIDDAYLASSWLTKFYRGVLFQMILFGA